MRRHEQRKYNINEGERIMTGVTVERTREQRIRTELVLGEVARERDAQEAKHGDQSHLPDGTGPDRILSMRRAEDIAHWAKARCKAASQNEGGDGSITFEHILTEEWAEAVAESDPAKLRAELIQVIAVGVQWVEAIDRRPAQRRESADG
jgi:hypothetical protein